jgi:hypothetical protein
MTLEIAGEVHNLSALMALMDLASSGRLKPEGVAWLKYFVTSLNSIDKAEVKQALTILKSFHVKDFVYLDHLPRSITAKLFHPIRAMSQAATNTIVKEAAKILDPAKLEALIVLSLEKSSDSEDDRSVESSPTTIVSVRSDAA